MGYVEQIGFEDFMDRGKRVVQELSINWFMPVSHSVYPCSRCWHKPDQDPKGRYFSIPVFLTLSCSDLDKRITSGCAMDADPYFVDEGDIEAA